MKRKFLGTTLACIWIGGCAFPNAPTVSENDHALPAKPGGQLVSLNTTPALPRMEDQERENLMQKINDLDNELSDLKSKLQAATPAVAAAAAEKPVIPVLATKSKKARLVKPADESVASTDVPRETIVIQDTGMIFRVMHNYAKTDFRPSKSLQQQLLQAARAGKRIEIRGRTDATSPNPVDREIALQRALNARVFLANNGIHPRKMQVNYMAAGDNVASNATADGRARNRRVEIETAGITPHVLEDMAAVIRQDLQ